MNGTYRIPLGENQDPAEHPKVKRLLSALDPGAKYTITVHDAPLTLSTGRYHYGRPVTDTSSHERFVEIRARGGKCRVRKPARAKLTVPAGPSVESLEKRLAEARDAVNGWRLVFPKHLKAQYLDETYYADERQVLEVDARNRVKHRRIGRAVARILARHNRMTPGNRYSPLTFEDYEELDAAAGRTVERASKVSANQIERYNGYLGVIVSRYAGSHRFGVKREKPGAEPPSDPRPNAVGYFLAAKADYEFAAELVRLAREKSPCKLEIAA